jgi:copper chaperone CopZ
VSLKAVSGVDSVDVSLEKGLAAVKMKPGNKATLKQLNEAITKNGFTMKDSTATIAGTVADVNGKPMLRVSGSNDQLALVPEASASNAASMVGKSVVVSGTIPEAPKGKAPDSIHCRSITEEQPK